MNILYSLATLAIEISLAYAWKAHSIEPAGNVLLFWLWFIAIASLLVGLYGGINKSDIDKQGRARKIYGTARFIACIVFLAWYGHYILGVVLLIGRLMVAAQLHHANTKATA